MQMAALNNVMLHWREDGDPNGQPVVFANSLGTDLRLWDGVIPLLPDGLRLIRYDKRGHGLSSCPTGPFSMEDLVADAKALLGHVGVQNCIFVGLSIGGMIAQSLAFDRSDLVRALVLSNTAARMGEPVMWQDRIAAVRAGGMASVADGILERWFSASFRELPEIELWRNMLTSTPVDGYVGCCHAIAGADLTATTGQLSLPVLGIGGTEDLASPTEQVAATTALVPGARFEEIQGVGHLPCVENPERYAEIIGAFIDEVRHG